MHDLIAGIACCQSNRPLPFPRSIYCSEYSGQFEQQEHRTENCDNCHMADLTVLAARTFASESHDCSVPMAHRKKVMEYSSPRAAWSEAVLNVVMVVNANNSSIIYFRTHQATPETYAFCSILQQPKWPNNCGIPNYTPR
jgi:hypothetical protein